MAILEVKNVKKIYATRFGGAKIEALRDVNFEVENGEYIAKRFGKDDSPQHHCFP